MATNDWKKYNNKWKQLKSIADDPDFKGIKEYRNVEILHIGNLYYVSVYLSFAGLITPLSKDKSFKTKAEALKFAKAYMEKH